MGRNGYDVGRLISSPPHTAIWMAMLPLYGFPAMCSVCCIPRHQGSKLLLYDMTDIVERWQDVSCVRAAAHIQLESSYNPDCDGYDGGGVRKP